MIRLNENYEKKKKKCAEKRMVREVEKEEEEEEDGGRIRMPVNINETHCEESS